MNRHDAQRYLAARRPSEAHRTGTDSRGRVWMHDPALGHERALSPVRGTFSQARLDAFLATFIGDRKDTKA